MWKRVARLGLATIIGYNYFTFDAEQDYRVSSLAIYDEKTRHRMEEPNHGIKFESIKVSEKKETKQKKHP